MRVAGFAVVAAVLWGSAGTAEAATAGSVKFTAPREVRVGDAIRLTAQAVGGGARAFQATVAFNGRLAERNGLRVGGRHALGPVLRGDTETFGFYSRRGAAATSRLGTLELLAKRRGVLRLTVTGVKAADGRGTETTYRAVRRTLVVRIARKRSAARGLRSALRLRRSDTSRRRLHSAGLDLTGDAVVDRADAADAALAWTRAYEYGAPCRSTTADADGDGCLDVADVQGVASRALVRKPLPPRAKDSAGATFVVNSGGDGSDSSADGVCRASDGSCTLRAAITEANRQSGSNLITFDIPGGGTRTIQLTSALPALSDTTGPTTIDGYTQPDAEPNTADLASNAQIRIQIAGTGYSEKGVDAFAITSPNNLIRGVAVYNIRKSLRIYGSSADGNRIVGNFIGTNAAGTAVASAYNLQGTGITVEQGASANRIGDTAPADRNVISGNSRHGASLYGIGTDANVFYNNIIGLAPLGDRRLENKKHGIDLNTGSARNVIGGTQPGQRNVLSGNGLSVLDDFTAAVEISHMSETTGNKVIGNYIGTDLTGSSGPSYAFNSHYGIRVEDWANDVTVAHNIIGNNRWGGIKVDGRGTKNVRIHDNRFGISNTGAAVPNPSFGVFIDFRATKVVVGPNNIITNSPTGVRIQHSDTDFNTVTRNSIYGNSGLGIDLEPITHVNPNDAGDGDTGANQGLNFPVITNVSSSSVSGTACAGCTVELFLADGGAGAYGEGKTFLGSATANSSGAWTIPVAGSEGQYVTATATDSSGNTSEFGLNTPLRDSGDNTPPSSSITCNGTACSSSPYSSAVSVALSATDSGSGVREIRYTTDGSDPGQASALYTAPFTVSDTTTVKFRAWDNAGNAEAVNSQTIEIASDADTTPPTTSISCDGSQCAASPYPAAVQVELSASDAESGVSEIRYTTDGSDPSKASSRYTGPFSILQTATVKYRAWDNAGNIEQVRSQLIQIAASGAFVHDDFEREVASGFGTADVGGTWNVSSPTRTKVEDGDAVLYAWTGGNQDVHAWIDAMRADMELLTLVRLNGSNPSGANYQARAMARAQSDPRNGYSARLTHTTSGAVNWSLARMANAGGTDSVVLGSGALASSGGGGSSWWIRLRVQGTSIQAKFWRDGSAEPADWTRSVTDGYWTSGRPSLGVYVGSGLTTPFPSIGFESFSASDPG